MTALDQLAERRLVVVTGKGGVGKTTLAAAIGRLLAARGRRTLLLEVDPRESLHQLLATDPSDGAIIRAGPNLSLQNLQPRAVVDDLVREKVRVGMLARKITGNVVFQHFADGAPGLKEMALLGYARRTVSGDYRHKADVVVLDAPATGHSATMLAAPLLLAEAIGGGQLGEMAADLAAFVADPGQVGVVLATLAEEMPVQEAIELVELLRKKIGRPPELVIANALYPSLPAGAARQKPAGTAEVLRLWGRRRAVNDREIRRLRGSWKGALVTVPLLPLERGPALLEAVQHALEGALA